MSRTEVAAFVDERLVDRDARETFRGERQVVWVQPFADVLDSRRRHAIKFKDGVTTGTVTKSGSPMGRQPWEIKHCIATLPRKATPAACTIDLLIDKARMVSSLSATTRHAPKNGCIRTTLSTSDNNRCTSVVYRSGSSNRPSGVSDAQPTRRSLHPRPTLRSRCKWVRIQRLAYHKLRLRVLGLVQLRAAHNAGAKQPTT